MQVTVSWNPVTLDDTGNPVAVSHYNLYRDGVLLYSPILGTTYDDQVAGGVTAVYEVSAVGPGGEGAKSLPATFTAPSGVPVAPDGVTVA